ncbi:MAG: hypothetical protein ACP5NK_05425 [Thermoplasmata archaeon]
MVFTIMSVQNASGTSVGTPQVYDTILLIVIILLLVLRRSIRSIRGRKFSKRRIIQRPLLLVILSAVFLFFPVFYQSDIVYFILSIVAGTIIGTRLGTLSTVYSDRGDFYYRSSIILTSLWLVTYVSRLILELFFNVSSYLIDTVFIILLSFSAGLFLGEAINLIEKYNVAKATLEQQSQDSVEK